MSLEKVIETVNRGSTFLVVSHYGIDGDGIGSELALARFLRSIGKKATIMNNEPSPPNYSFLERSDDAIVIFNPHDDSLLRSCDAIFVLDNNNSERLGPMEKPVLDSPIPKVCIDHHSPVGENLDVYVIDQSASATAEIIHDLIIAMGGAITFELAEPLYAAIITDTGSFQFSKTSSRTHKIAAALLEAGVKPQRVHEEIYEKNSASLIRLTGGILSTLEIACRGKLAYFTITRKMLEDHGGTEEDTSDIVNYTLSIAGTLCGAVFRELEDGTTKVSLRSKAGIDINEFARQFRGGGHRHAAGILINKDLENARKEVIRALDRFFEKRR